MGMQESYLFELYAQLGIQSTYIPSFYDGNEKYVTNANLANLSSPSTRASLLPKKLITVVGSK